MTKMFTVRQWRRIAFGLYAILGSSFLLFCLLEWFPQLLSVVHLQSIRYFALKERYVTDDVLVLAPRRGAHTREYDFRGDLAANDEVPTIHMVASFTADGFRTNSSNPPYDVVLIGDSYLQAGESDVDTFSERLKAVSGLSTLNLGRAWYGPYQYVELLKRYAPSAGAKTVVLCFFDGNDAEDVRQYEQWRNGGDYYSFVIARNLFWRYVVAASDVAAAAHDSAGRLQQRAKTWLTRAPASRGPAWVEPREGNIRLGRDLVRMRFAYWNRVETTGQMLARPEWQTIRRLVGEFKAIAQSQGMTPLLLFIPTKLEVYGRLAGESGGDYFVRSIGSQVGVETNSENALRELAKTHGMAIVDLLPDFQKRARRGELLYHPFDTHWNSAGRLAAAELMAEALRPLPLN